MIFFTLTAHICGVQRVYYLVSYWIGHFKNFNFEILVLSVLQTGLVLGIYDSPGGAHCPQELTEAGERFNEHTNGLIKEILKKLVVCRFPNYFHLYL